MEIEDKTTKEKILMLNSDNDTFKKDLDLSSIHLFNSLIENLKSSLDSGNPELILEVLKQVHCITKEYVIFFDQKCKESIFFECLFAICFTIRLDSDDIAIEIYDKAYNMIIELLYQSKGGVFHSKFIECNIIENIWYKLFFFTEKQLDICLSIINKLLAGPSKSDVLQRLCIYDEIVLLEYFIESGVSLLRTKNFPKILYLIFFKTAKHGSSDVQTFLDYLEYICGCSMPNINHILLNILINIVIQYPVSAFLIGNNNIFTNIINNSLRSRFRKDIIPALSLSSMIYEQFILKSNTRKRLPTIDILSILELIHIDQNDEILEVVLDLIYQMCVKHIFVNNFVELSCIDALLEIYSFGAIDIRLKIASIFNRMCTLSPKPIKILYQYGFLTTLLETIQYLGNNCCLLQLLESFDSLFSNYPSDFFTSNQSYEEVFELIGICIGNPELEYYHKPLMGINDTICGWNFDSPSANQGVCITEKV